MADLTSFAPALKTIYEDKLLAIATMQTRPLLGLLPKYEQFGGDYLPLPVKYSNQQMRSHTFATAQGTSLNSAWVKFLLTRTENHSLAHVSSHVAAASGDSRKAYLKALKTEIDSAFDALADSLETELFRSKDGVLGQVGTSGITTTTLTLSDVNDVSNFEVNMELCASATATGSLIDSGNTATVTGINRVDGELTTDSNWTSQISGLTDAYYLFQQGDAADGGTELALSGLASWGPSSAPSASESFFGVDRSVSSRLYFVIYDGSSEMIEEALIGGQSTAAQLHEGQIDTFIINNAQYRKLAKQLGAKKEYSEVNAQGGKGMYANISYRGFKVQGDHGEITVVAANKCQSTIGWGIEKQNVCLYSLGPAMRFDDTDGQTILRRASASGVEARTVSWSQLGIKSPGHNVRITFAAA